MRRPAAAVAAIACAGALIAAAPVARAQVAGAEQNLSMKLEVQYAIDQGIKFLTKQQGEAGHWSDAGQPGITALAIAAILGDPSRESEAAAALPPALGKAFAYLLSCRQLDGGIYREGFGAGNTSAAVMALLLSGDPEHDATIREARRFLINAQQDFDARGEADHPLDGGIGFGAIYAHADLSTTQFALEALFFSASLAGEPRTAPARELDRDAAIAFITRCQNLPGHNDQPWASGDPANRGGFVFFPGMSRAGEMPLGSGKAALRSSGGMTCAGLLSLLYAGVDKRDPRPAAAIDWLAKHYTLDENPGLGAAGRYFYLYSLAKALALSRVGEIETGAGKAVDWRKDLALKFFDLQSQDGSWVNKDDGRWREDDPVLATAYAVLALEHLYRAL
ncbi:MAG: prenyltransferase/squalene oxidase repeat-containing protein [Verrucomicrobiales bacterium]